MELYNFFLHNMIPLIILHKKFLLRLNFRKINGK